MNILRTYPNLSLLLLSALGLTLFLVLTNPQNINIGLLIVPVVLFFLIIYSLVQLFITRLNLIKSHPRKRRIVAIVSATLLTTIMIVESTGGISLADAILLLLIVIVAAVYIDKF